MSQEVSNTPFVTGAPSLLSRICEAQTKNAALTGEDLHAAARDLSLLATGTRRVLLAVDGIGERLIGVALVQGHDVHAVEASRHLDGLDVLLVAGHVAGTTGIAMKAELARSLGARSVEVATLDGLALPISGCDRVLQVSPRRRLLAL